MTTLALDHACATRNTFVQRIAIAIVCLLPNIARSEDQPPEIPREWKIVVTSKNSYHLNPKHSDSYELNHLGTWSQSVQSKTTPHSASTEKLAEPRTQVGLHLIWSILEDARLIGGNVEDADIVKVQLETGSWTWQRSWNTIEDLRTADPRLRMFVELPKQLAIDSKSYRTNHKTSAELRNQWLSDWNSRNKNYRYFHFHTSVDRGQTRYECAPVKDGWEFASVGGRIKRPMQFVKSEPPGLSVDEYINVMAEMHSNLKERNPEDTNQLEMAVSSGSHDTLFRLKHLKDRSEIGPVAKAFLEKADAAFAKANETKKD